jgi:hypothetical protein
MMNLLLSEQRVCAASPEVLAKITVEASPAFAWRRISMACTPLLLAACVSFIRQDLYQISLIKTREPTIAIRWT